jgi:hypothetical protein
MLQAGTPASLLGTPADLDAVPSGDAVVVLALEAVAGNRPNGPGVLVAMPVGPDADAADGASAHPLARMSDTIAR